MKQFLFPIVWTWTALFQLLHAEDTPAAPATSSGTAAPQILGPVFNGEFVPPAPKQPLPAVPESKVIQRSRIADGGRTITLEQVLPPEEPPAATQPAVPQLTPEEIAAHRAAWIAERRAHPVVMLNLGGTVYDHKATLLTWRYGDEQYQAWSNLDFNLMRGLSRVAANGTTYNIYMMFTDISSAPRRTKSGVILTPKIPEIPPLPVEAGFVVVQGDPDNADALRGVRMLHDLYSTHRDTLIAAFENRKRYEAAARAWQEAHPPQPEDITIRWWRGPDTAPAAKQEVAP